MGLLLLLLFLLTLAYLGYFLMPGARRTESVALGRVITGAYVGSSGFLIAILLISYLGFPGETVHKLVRHIEYRGVAVTVPSISGDTSNVRISSNLVDSEAEVKRAFRWFALPSGAWIDLRPDQTEGKRILSYRASAHQSIDVVRLNRICVNDTVGGWLKVGEKAEFRYVQRKRSDRRTSPKFFTGPGVAFSISVEANQVEIRSGDFDGETKKAPLLDRSSLRDALNATGNKQLIRALAARDDLGDSILDQVQLVRYKRKDGESALGVVFRSGAKIAQGALSDPDDTYNDLYRNFPTGTARTEAPIAPAVAAIEGVFRLDIFGSDNRSSLVLPPTAESTEGGHAQLRFLFDPPRAYPLPPSDVLRSRDHTVQLASADLGQDGNGYIFDTGNLNEGFLATATVSDDGTKLAIGSNSSDASKPVVPNENQVLGGGSVAPIFALADPLRDQGMPWLLPVIALVVGLLVCVGSFARIPFLPKSRGRRVPVNVASSHAAFVLWVVTSAVLAVRLVLAFRVSILPPFNMDAVSAATFRSAWTKALIPGCLIPPFIGILTFAVVRAKQAGVKQRWTENVGEWTVGFLRKASDRPWRFMSRCAYGSATTFAFLMVVQKLVHFPMPDMVLVGVLFVILGLVFDGVGEAKDDEFAETPVNQPTAQVRLGSFAERFPWLQKVLSKRNLWDRNPLLWSASILLFILDPGTFLFFIPVTVALCVGGLIAGFGKAGGNQERNVNLRSAGSKLGLVAILGVVLFGIAFCVPIGSRLLTNPIAAKVIKSTAFPYRLVATDPLAAEHLMVDPDTGRTSFSAHHMQETLHQRWQMIAYQRGSGVGYFAAPLRNVGMTYPTTLSDAAFSVYLVGEHGKLAGVMVIGLLLLLSLAIFRCAWLAASSRNQKANARGLYAIAGVIGCATVYMALANLWLIPFTGQNVPLLSLNSWKDLILNLTLLVAAILLIAFPGTWSSQIDPIARKDAKANALAWWAFPALLAVGFVWLAVNLSATSGDPAQPFNMGSSTLAAIQHTVDDARQQAGLKQISLEKTAAVKGASSFIRQLVAGFDAGEVTRTPIMEARGAGSTLVVDKRFFLLKSPFEKDLGVAWHGSELATGMIRRRQLVVGGSRVPIILESGRGPSEIYLGRPVKPIIAQSIDLKQLDDRKGSKGSRMIDYGGIKLDGEKILLRWKNFGKPGTILVNGKRPDLKFNELEINESDIVSLEYTGPDGVPQKLSIHYLGATEAKLASVVWRNGRFGRTYPQGADFPLAFTIGEIGDDLVRLGSKKDEDLQLSVDMQLQHDLLTELRSWGRSRSRLIDRGAPMPDGLPFTAISVLDSSSGQIRALASIPQCDPREDFSKVENRFSNESDAMIAARSSWTLVNRTIGSTIKPLGFSALNSQLDSKTFDLTKLHVSEAAGVETYVDKDGKTRRAYRNLGDIHLKQGKGLGSRENPRSDVDMFAYLKDSRTWPAIVTSTLGLVADKSHPAEMKQELAKILTPSAGGPVSMGGARMAFLPHLALRRVFPRTTTLSSIELADTAYFKGIEQCFGPSVVPFNINEAKRWDDGLEKRFLAPFDLNKSSKQTFKNLGLPEVHWADTTNLTDLDGQLVRYMIGGGECRWNAVTMAANFARLTTGKKVQPTLSTNATPIKEAMPAPLNTFAWRKAHLLNPLFEITTIPADDVAEIRATVAKAGYRIAMKTGTIDDGMGKKAMESEMLMFTVGKYDEATGFAPGHSISGFFSIRSAKRAEGDVMVKGDLIKRSMPILVGFLKRMEIQKGKGK